MERKLIFLLTTCVMFVTAVVGWNQPIRAAMCGKCRDLMFIDSDGKCTDCGGSTTSSALQLCPKCSAKRHQCEHCLAPTTAKDEAAAPQAQQSLTPEPTATTEKKGDAQTGGANDNPPPSSAGPANASNSTSPDNSPLRLPGPETNPLPPAEKTEKPIAPIYPETKSPAELPSDIAPQGTLKPINPAKAGTYTSGKWQFHLQITSPGTRTEGRWGWLTYDGQKLPRGEANDYYNTPWGPIYWVDVPTTAWGVHGWMPVPQAQNRRQGRQLATPGTTAARNAATPANPADSVATRPRTGILEINKTHNGQLAKLRVGNVLVIRLPGNPSSGYQWQGAKTNSTAMRLTVRPQYSPTVATAGQGAAGTYTFIFQAVQPGSGSIRLNYTRPGDPARPRDTFTVGVNVAATATTTAAATRPATAATESRAR